MPKMVLSSSLALLLMMLEALLILS